MKKAIMLSLGILILLVGCSQATEVPPTQELKREPTQLPTDTKVPPTDTTEPTATPKPPTLTPLPEGMLFRDDFESSMQPGWEWINENPEKWSFVEFGDSYWLRIVGDKPGNFEDQTNTLMRSLPEGDFVITAHVIADPRQNHHQANIFIFEDAHNYIRMNFGFCDHCGLAE